MDAGGEKEVGKGTGDGMPWACTVHTPAVLPSRGEIWIAGGVVRVIKREGGGMEDRKGWGVVVRVAVPDLCAYRSKIRHFVTRKGRSTLGERGEAERIRFVGSIYSGPYCH